MAKLPGLTLACATLLLIGLISIQPGFVNAQAQNPQRWGEDWDGDGKDDHFFRDGDRDGKPELMTVDTDEDGTPEEAWLDLDDDGDWDAKMENDGDNKNAADLPDWDRSKNDTDKDHDFDKVTEDTDNDGSFLDETPSDLNPQEAIPANQPQETGDQRNQGCVGPGCPNPILLGACGLSGGGCINDTDSGMCSAFGAYSGNGTVCQTVTAFPGTSTWSILAASLLLGMYGVFTIRRRQVKRSAT